jgi:hypothetical protein
MTARDFIENELLSFVDSFDNIIAAKSIALYIRGSRHKWDKPNTAKPLPALPEKLENIYISPLGDDSYPIALTKEQKAINQIIDYLAARDEEINREKTL